MALKGLRVVEMAGLAPAPFCGMILADFGADVIRVDRAGPDMDRLARGKTSIAVNLKKPEGIEIVKKLCSSSDVLIEPFRKGVMERLGLGPAVLMKENPRLVYARLTGYGQDGQLSTRAGHDINYLAISGLLSMLGRKGEKPLFPINLLADFAGGGLMCALGITLALLERANSGKGQVIDSNMVEGAAYVGSFIYRTRDLPIWPNQTERGTNWLDSGAHFYDTYQTKDGKYMAVGAIEPQFYDKLLEGLGLSHGDAPQFGEFDEIKTKFTDVFATKTQTEWCKIFDDVDACVTPILSMEEAESYRHNVERKSFLKNPEKNWMEPGPAPLLTRSPGVDHVKPQPEIGQHTQEILAQLGYSNQQVTKLANDGVVELASSKL